MQKRKKKTTATASSSRVSTDAMKRSATMRAVRSEGTGPEVIVRAMVRNLRRRPRLNDVSLPGKPDLVFPTRRKVILVHGCFWHGHSCGRGDRVPKTNRDYWIQKIARNRIRDEEATRTLRELGWKSLVVWECETRELETLARRLRSFLA
jgi:DNA mismatch endonuclease (patch repair protein)